MGSFRQIGLCCFCSFGSWCVGGQWRARRGAGEGERENFGIYSNWWYSEGKMETVTIASFFKSISVSRRPCWIAQKDGNFRSRGPMQQTFCRLTPYNTHDSVSLMRLRSYSKLISQSTFNISADADCSGLLGWLAQWLGNKCHQLRNFQNSYSLRACCTCKEN